MQMNSSVTIERKRTDCTALPKGWHREEVLHKSGISAGKVDVVYYSPTGKRIDSKPQLARHLGDTIDISSFDFQTGKIIKYHLPPPSISLYRCHNNAPTSTTGASAPPYASGGSEFGTVNTSVATTPTPPSLPPPPPPSSSLSLSSQSLPPPAANVLKRKYKAQTSQNPTTNTNPGLHQLSNATSLTSNNNNPGAAVNPASSSAPNPTSGSALASVNSRHQQQQQQQQHQQQQHEYSRGIRPDNSLLPPIRQTASIFKQPVTLVRNHENGKVKHDPKHGGAQEKPKQLFWEKRLERLHACHASTGDQFDNIALPKGIRAIGPNVNDQTVLQSVATALHVLNAPVTGQSSTKTEFNKNATAFINPDQPLMQAVYITEDDIRRQEDRVNAARRKLQEALKA